MKRHALSTGLLFAVLAAVGCGSSSPSGGTGGTTGGTGGTTGGTGGTTGAAFMAIKPCETEAAYTTTGTTVSFDMDKDTAYTPKCLKVPKGTMVTFESKGGDFSVHPLKPSKRGDAANNPITMTNSGTTVKFTFDKAGFFPYFCANHGFLDNGTMMDGMVWAY